MAETLSSREFLLNLRDHTLREIAASKAHLIGLWNLPLHDRVEKGHALGPLKVVSQNGHRLILAHQTSHSAESFSRLREADRIRLTRDQPLANGPSALFLQDTGEEITLELESTTELPFSPPLTGLTIDPDFFDPTDWFLAALEALGQTDHGREVVLPVLMGQAHNQTDANHYNEILDELETLPANQALHIQQQEAIALCLAASRFHLVQGPPGTGKTHVLAEIAARLVESGHRVLLTGPTHRSIEHALQACRKRIPASIPVVKISKTMLDRSSSVGHFETLAKAELPFDAPFVLGATPYSLSSSHSGLANEFFDTVLLDEASQLTLMLATLAMLHAEKFLFFGDHCQLPPVRLGPAPQDPIADSIFNQFRKSSATTMLTESWRLNQDLVEWPSATFYGNRLTARHDRLLTLSPPTPHPALQAHPGFLALPCPGPKTSSRSAHEAEISVELILELLRGGLAPADLAVVTPFRAQAALIRRMLRGREVFTPWPVADLVVDTVERLQGQEREVILVSLVASREAFILRLEDFLFDPRRLNVALTRARRKTILLYHPGLLKTAQSLAESGHPGATTFCSLLGS